MSFDSSPNQVSFWGDYDRYSLWLLTARQGGSNAQGRGSRAGTHTPASTFEAKYNFSVHSAKSPAELTRGSL